MASFKIRGGRPLNGEIRVQGSKNAALPILSACLLTKGVTKLYNCPQIADVYNMIKILRNMGCHVEICGDCVSIDTSGKLFGEIGKEDAAAMRSSVMLLGAMLSRFHSVDLPWPGGCSIGKRPLDIHLAALEKMNVSVAACENGITCQTTGLQGNKICFSYPSVGATENVILAAVCACGTTTIWQAAREPEIIDLCLFLNEMGADIHGMGTSCIIIRGVKKLRSVSYKIMTDRIVAGTYLAAATATGGSVTVCDVCEHHMHATLDALAGMGSGIMVWKNKIRVIGPEILLPLECIHTKPFPGFPTDMQSQLMVCLAAARGDSQICEDVFEDRFKIVPEIEKMGADVLIKNQRAIIRGVKTLHGAKVFARDLRGGAALVIAGVMAEGMTQVCGAAHIERGYQDICCDLTGLGADIHRI